MKQIFIPIFLLITCSLSAQYQAPIGYNSVAPTTVAPSANGTWLRINTSNGRQYIWSPTLAAWVTLAQGFDNTVGCVAPSYTPAIGQSTFAANGCNPPELYAYYSSAWHCMNCETGATYTAGTGISISVGNEISNTGDLSNTNELQSLSLSGQDLSISSGTGTTLPVVGITAGSGITATPTAGVYNIVNTSPDQTVSISGASGTYPNFTLPTSEVPLTFSQGVTRTTNDVKNDLITGKSGGQTVVGGTASGNSLTLSSTNNTTKGKVLIGTSAYDEVNNRLGIANSSPGRLLTIGAAGAGFDLYTSSAANDAVKSVASSSGAGWGVQNTNSSGFSGVEYLDNAGNLAVFTGYRNGGTGEFRFNNIATSGFITFKIASTDRLVIANSGLVTISNSLSLSTAGSKLNIATGTNASIGTATLVAGAVTVNTTAVTSSSQIIVCYNTPSGTLASGLSAPSASIVNGTSFVINSLTTAGVVNTLDTSTVRYWIIN